MVNIELPLAVSIPSDYIPDKNTRLGVYRRLADMHDTSEVDALAEELGDRFGPLPHLVENLLFQARVKILADRAKLASLTAENGQFVMRFPDPEMLQGMDDIQPYARVGKTALWMPYMELLDWRKQLLFVLNKLIEMGA
jgi:transcription-repair coupling factor (superfamily II helicase)